MVSTLSNTSQEVEGMATPFTSTLAAAASRKLHGNVTFVPSIGIVKEYEPVGPAIIVGLKNEKLNTFALALDESF